MRSTVTPVRRALAYALDGESGVTLRLSARNSLTLGLELISVTNKNIGAGSRVLSNLTRYADINGLSIELSPSSVFGSDPVRLRKWYERHGFVNFKGNKMIRHPQNAFV